MSRPIVILDRDGTLIDFVRDAELGIVTPAFHPSQLRLLPGVVSGLTLLAEAGFALAIATNQPDAAKGRVPREAIERTNAALVELLLRERVVIEATFCCLHHPEGGPGGVPELIGPCACRKPLPGLLQRALATMDGDPTRSWMIGDTPTDVQAARAAGVRAGLLFAEGRCELCPLRGSTIAPDRAAASVNELARAITADRTPR